MEKPITGPTATDRVITRITSYLAVVIIIFLVYKGIRILVDLYRYEETNDAQVQEYINPLVNRVDGYVREIRYEENQEVQKGDTLIIIDPKEYDAKKQESQEAVNAASAQIEVLQSNIETSEKLAQASRNQIDAARAKLVRAKKDFERYNMLLSQESATGQQVEAKKEAQDVSSAEYASAMANYQADLSKINNYRVERDGILAEIKRRKALEQQADLSLSYTVITAPYHGKISRKSIQVGQFVQANQSLANIVNSSIDKWVVANFKETQISGIHDGQSVLLEADAYPGTLFHGKIQSLSPGTGSSFTLLPPDNSTGNFVKVVQRIPIKIIFSDGHEDKGMLRSGMNMTVKVIK
ncbi:HlyD family secretion protein [Pedobacter sp. 22163]|uniref:HlyD family secretion protein n=1 Tax=Pedobacter sp. 22163 TaxID=3453883 RepID=UPI003F8575EC